MERRVHRSAMWLKLSRIRRLVCSTPGCLLGTLGYQVVCPTCRVVGCAGAGSQGVRALREGQRLEMVPGVTLGIV